MAKTTSPKKEEKTISASSITPPVDNPDAKSVTFKTKDVSEDTEDTSGMPLTNPASTPGELEKANDDIMRAIKQAGNVTEGMKLYAKGQRTSPEQIALEKQRVGEVATQEKYSGNAELISQIGKRKLAIPGEYAGLTPTKTDWGGVIAAAGKAILPKSLGSAGYIAAGAGIGSVVPGIGTAIGAAGGYIAQIVSAGISAVDSQKTETKQQQLEVLKGAKSQMPAMVVATKADPENAAKYVEVYNLWVSKTYEAYQQMELDTRSDPLKFRDNRLELQKFENFFGAGGYKETMDLKMAMAMMGKDPDPTGQIALQNMIGGIAGEEE